MATKSMSRPPVNTAVVSKGKLKLPGAKPAPVVSRSASPSSTTVRVPRANPKPEPEVVIASGKKVTEGLGQPLAALPNKSCMQCKRFSQCHDENKSFSYLCTRFSQRILEARDIDADVSDIPDRQAYRQGKTLANPSKLLKGSENWTEAQGRAKERSLEKMMSRILESAGVVAQDARIDDRDLPTAPNFFTWITDPAYAGNLVKPWAKQIEHPTKLFNEYCPNPKCTDLKWWHNVPVDAKPHHFLEHVTFLEHGVCPRCAATKSEMVADGILKPYNELVGLAGQRASKTFSVMMQITYDLHRVLKSQNPQSMLGVAGSQILTGTFTALTFAQAKSNMWDPLFNMLSEATWFQNYHEMLDQIGKRIGVELFALKDTFLRYRHRNLLYAPSSPNMRTARGFTRMTGAVDEIGLMHNELAKNGKTRERMNASEIYNSIGNSLVTVREAALEALLMGHDNITMGYFYNISSPFSRKDMIMTLYERSRGSDTIYGYRAATWEMNPKIKRDGRLMTEKFRQDAIAAMRDFGAVPPISGAPFIRLSSLANTFHKKIGNDATLSTVIIKNQSGGNQTSGKLKFHRDYGGGPTVVAIDAGANFNSFAVAVIEKVGEKGNKGRVRFAGEILLSPEAPAHFPAIMRNVVQPLIQHYGASVLVADRWNSIHLLQQMEEEEGIAPLQHSLKYPEFERFRQGIYDEWLRLPALELKPKEALRLANQPGYPSAFNGKPISHLIYQMVAVQDVPNVTVMKPDAGTDDIFRAVVLGWHIATDPTMADYFVQAQGPRPSRTIGVVTRGRDGASGSVSNTMGVKRSFGMGGSNGNSMGAVRRASA